MEHKNLENLVDKIDEEIIKSVITSFQKETLMNTSFCESTRTKDMKGCSKCITRSSCKTFIILKKLQVLLSLVLKNKTILSIDDFSLMRELITSSVILLI